MAERDGLILNCLRWLVVQVDFKIGDLVQLKSYCRGSGRLALIIEMAYLQNCSIVYMDTGEKVTAKLANLEMVSESR